jgi:hypothetical protein
MRRNWDAVPLAALMAIALLTPPRVARASNDEYPHTYYGCLQAASYQRAECVANFPKQYSTCMDTFEFLRDHRHGCHQFPM